MGTYRDSSPNFSQVDYYTVIFNCQDGTNNVEDVVKQGENITLPFPAKEIYTFDGWYSSNLSGTRIGEAGDNYIVNRKTTLYARWALNYYAVSFDSNNGSAVSQVTNVAHGSKITKPNEPTKSGYAFGGWYKDSSLTKLWNFSNNVVTGNLTLVAVWIPFYTVSFDAQGGTSVNSMTNVQNSTEIILPYTSRNGYTFDGWYSANLSGTRVGGAGDSYVVNGSITLGSIPIRPHFLNLAP